MLEFLFNKVTGLKACILIKERPLWTLQSFYEQLFYRTPVSYTFSKFYVMIDTRYSRVLFYYCKIRPRNRKNFMIDESKFLVKRWFILNLDFNSPSRFLLLFNHLAFKEICKNSKLQRETSGSNWTILVSNFSNYN